MNNNDLKRIVSRFEGEQRAKTQKAIDYVLKAIKSGQKTDIAISDAIKIVALDSKEVEGALYEAAAYGYGINPSVAVVDSVQRDLSKAWNPDGMTLSQRLHGTNEQMREAVIDVVRTQLKKNEAMVTASRKLYEGYGQGGILTQKKAAEYIQKVRVATGGDLDAVRAVRKATNNIMRLSENGAPNQALKAAYQKVVDMALTGTEETLAKAVEVAFEEKSRYVADRIIRTEASRAYADGFYAQTLKDGDVVAFQFKLSTRHPVEDICDLYAEADLFGMGAGVYPKDQCPEIPVHPNCLCYYSPIYKGEVDKPSQNIAEGGKEWLESLTDEERKRVLGVAGAREFESGGNWQGILSDFELIEPKSRLEGNTIRLLQERAVSQIPPEYNADGQPTNNYLKKIAKARDIEYNDTYNDIRRFFDSTGTRLICPPNNGAVGRETKIVLPKGTQILRYGDRLGKFASQIGVNIEKLSLPPSTKLNEKLVITLNKNTTCFSSKIAPWFEQKGGAIQYRFEKSMKNLFEEGIITVQ